MADVGRDGDGGDGEADGLALAAAGAADGVAHEQELGDVSGAEAGAAEALADAELALQGDTARHLSDLGLADGVGGPEGTGDVLWLLAGHEGSS